MLKKWLLSLVITFAMLILFSFLIKNTNISFDKDSNYKAKLPRLMRAAHFKNESDKDFYKNIQTTTQELPIIGDDDVLVYVKAATFTQRDHDFFRVNKGRKDFIPCSDFAGIIVDVGKNVRLYEVGDKVFGIADIEKGRGACADYVAVSKNNIYTIPYSLTFKQAAMVPTPALLNWLALHNIERQGVKNGKVLVDDAISEVGIMLTGLLQKSGFDVTAIDDENVRGWVEGYGVKDFVSNSEFDSKKSSMLNKYDVVINLQNGLPVSELMKLVKKNGTFISYEKIDKKRKGIRTIVIDNRLIDKDVFAKMARLVHLGKLKLNITKEYNLEHIRDAYIRSVKGNNNGKVVVNIN